MTLDRSLAPWTADEINSLNAYQGCGYQHPFTSAGMILVATRDGWVLPLDTKGAIVQTWAHKFMTDWSWKASNELLKFTGLNKDRALDKSLTITCACSRLDHAVRFSKIDDSAYVDIVFRHESSFWRRAKTAWNYLFGTPCAFDGVSEVELGQVQLLKLAEWCAMCMGFKKMSLSHDPTSTHEQARE